MSSILKADKWAELAQRVVKTTGFPIHPKDLKSHIYNPPLAFKINVERVLALPHFPQLAFRQGIAHQLGVPKHLSLDGIHVPIPTQEEIWDRLDWELSGFFESIRHLMSLQIVSMWTTFETLAGDLWENAVNAHPKNLSELKGRLKKNAAVTEDNDTCDEVSDKHKEEGRSISVNSVQLYGFNLTTKMGTILRDEGKVKFDRLACIRDAYVRTFCKDNQLIRTAIYDGSLTALSIARNTIVHNAGICDEQSESDTNKNPSAKKILPAIRAGQHLELNGEIMNAILVPAIDSCTRLILAVDSWVAKHLEIQRKADKEAESKKEAQWQLRQQSRKRKL